ncbi:uncharacterized protein LOC143034959 [Oratosquilla oratoria]|uniref:uncharacterized protein LOC143034959 n=1 Tax=Oratosquilla oratoria TaxID=337810 RepID=UPI003F76F35F
MSVSNGFEVDDADVEEPVEDHRHELTIDVLAESQSEQVYKEEVMQMGHDSPFAGHMGVRKTLDRIWQHFYWPGIRKDVTQYCRSCHTCQVVGKPNQSVAVAPLKPIPVGEEPFAKVIADIVGPLPKTKNGNEYILTLMDTFSRYPEAVPLRRVHAKVVFQELIKFFTRWGLPRELQTDQGSVFLSKEVMQGLGALGIVKVTSSAYHPQSQGALERYHQTLKTMLKKWCLDNDTGWDQALPYLLFAVREVPNESMGISPFDMVFGHCVRGPLRVLKECLLEPLGAPKVIKSVEDMRSRLASCWQRARETLQSAQERMKQNYDRKARVREFKQGDKVLVLLPFQGNPLRAKFSGPYVVVKRVGELNYVVATPDRRRKEQLCHLNMLKDYQERDKNDVGGPGRSVCTVSIVPEEDEDSISPTLEMTWKTNAEKEIDYMLAHNLIQPAQSEWSSPAILVPKSDGTQRFCIDFRRVNAVTKKDSYPLPRIEECIDRVGGSRFISKLDLLRGYWQVPMTPRAQSISCFTTLGRTYQCNVMPFGMTNAPATFQRLMNNLTETIPGCVTYLDDVVIYSNTWQEHLSRLVLFFDKLVSANLVLNLSKCDFVKAKVRYLGYVVGQGEVAPPHAKVEAILNIVTPKSKREVRCFLGTIAYYRMFIYNFSALVAPLTDLLKKGTKFQWTETCNSAFVQAKSVLCTGPVLQAPDFSEPFHLYCDASNMGVGSVLLQTKNKVDHPVSYFSKKLNMAQLKYSTIEKELLSIILALKHFAVYIPVGAQSNTSPWGSNLAEAVSRVTLPIKKADTYAYAWPAPQTPFRKLKPLRMTWTQQQSERCRLSRQCQRSQGSQPAPNPASAAARRLVSPRAHEGVPALFLRTSPPA